MTDQEIADSLSEAQRELVSLSDGWKSAFMLDYARPNRFGVASGQRAAGHIRKSRLFEKRMGGAQSTEYHLTETGLRVRAILEKTNG